MKKVLTILLCLTMLLSITSFAVAQESDHVLFTLQSYNLMVGGDFNGDTTIEDIQDTFNQLAAAGYEGVEWCNFLFNVCGVTAEEVADAYQEAGLACTGMHYHYGGADTLEAAAADVVESCNTLDCDKLIFAYSTPATFDIAADEEGNWTAEQVDEWAAQINVVLAALRTAAEGTDIEIMYHNHATEFLKGTEGEYAVDMLDVDSLEIDVYWAAKNANTGYSVANVLEYVKANADMISLLHIKDGLDGSSVTDEMCGWGKGTYDIQSIIDTAKVSGVSSVVVENDRPNNFGTTGLEDALETAEYAKTLDFSK